MNFLGFGQSADLDIVFDNVEHRNQVDVKVDDGKKEKLLLYYDGETISGKVKVSLRKPGAKLEHQGIKIELIGQIELYYDRGNHYEFLSMAKELARPGDLLHSTEYPFEFLNVEKPYEIYMGTNVRLRYFLRITVIRRISDVIREIDICVHTLSSYPESNNPIKMEVGIEDCLHIEFEYNKSKYHLKDVIVGKIYFLLVRIKIKHMEIAIIKREQTGSGPHQYTESDTIAKYEIMDGAPVKGESIPIRVFLAGYDLTPTMRDINKKFNVKYFLNLVLMDTEDRRYFKQQEITLWRKADGGNALKARQQQHLQQQQSPSQQQPMSDPHLPSHLVGSEQNPISSVNNGEQLPSEKFHQQQRRSELAAAQSEQQSTADPGDGLHTPSAQSPGEEESLARGVNKMGLFTEEVLSDTEKSIPAAGKNNEGSATEEAEAEGGLKSALTDAVINSDEPPELEDPAQDQRRPKAAPRGNKAEKGSEAPQSLDDDDEDLFH